MATKYAWYYLTGSGSKGARALMASVQRIERDFKMSDRDVRKLWKHLYDRNPMTMEKWKEYILYIRSVLRIPS